MTSVIKGLVLGYLAVAFFALSMTAVDGAQIIIRNRLDPDNPTQQQDSTDSTQYCAVACYYVRPNGGSYGLENGSNWSNAFDGFSDIAWSSVACGSTIWVAGGTYTQNLTPSKTCTSDSTRVLIRRATADVTAVTSATGWSSSFDAQVVMNGSTISLGNIAYITISGLTADSTCGQYQGSCGWKVKASDNATSGTGVECPNGTSADFITVEYVELAGPGADTDFDGDGRGVDCTAITATPTHLVFSHIKNHDWESTFYFVPCSDCTIEDSEIYELDDADPNAPNSCCHPNMVYISASNGSTSAQNLVFQRNIMHGRIGEGVFYTNDTQDVHGSHLVGNLFFGVTEGKCFQLDNEGSVDGLKIFNNTFDGGCPQGIFAGDGPTSFTNTESRNNLMSRGSDTLPGTNSNNLTTSSASVFVDRANNDYHIVSTIGTGFARDAGADGSAYITTDLDGTTFGADGTYDIGAYEYVASAPSPAPAVLAFRLWQTMKDFVSPARRSR